MICLQRIVGAPPAVDSALPERCVRPSVSHEAIAHYLINRGATREHSPMRLQLPAFLILMASPAWAQESLRFQRQIVEKHTTGCVATFEYPEIITAGTSQARDRINAAILHVLLRKTEWPAPDSGFPSLDAYANDFIKGCA